MQELKEYVDTCIRGTYFQILENPKVLLIKKYSEDWFISSFQHPDAGKLYNELNSKPEGAVKPAIKAMQACKNCMELIISEWAKMEPTLPIFDKNAEFERWEDNVLGTIPLRKYAGMRRAGKRNGIVRCVNSAGSI